MSNVTPSTCISLSQILVLLIRYAGAEKAWAYRNALSSASEIPQFLIDRRYFLLFLEENYTGFPLTLQASLNSCLLLRQWVLKLTGSLKVRLILVRNWPYWCPSIFGHRVASSVSSWNKRQGTRRHKRLKGGGYATMPSVLGTTKEL
jgi:hypothetical protein